MLSLLRAPIPSHLGAVVVDPVVVRSGGAIRRCTPRAVVSELLARHTWWGAGAPAGVGADVDVDATAPAADATAVVFGWRVALGVG